MTVLYSPNSAKAEVRAPPATTTTNSMGQIPFSEVRPVKRMGCVFLELASAQRSMLPGQVPPD